MEYHFSLEVIDHKGSYVFSLANEKVYQKMWRNIFSVCDRIINGIHSQQEREGALDEINDVFLDKTIELP